MNNKDMPAINASKSDIPTSDLIIGETVSSACHVWPNDGGGADYIVVLNSDGEKAAKALLAQLEGESDE